MKKYLLISMILLGFNANAGYEAIGGLNSDSEVSFDAFCLEDGIWNKDCNDTQAAQPGQYNHLFHGNNEAVTFSFYDNEEGQTVFNVSCKADSAHWQDCTPDAANIPAGDYYTSFPPAHDGHGAYMLIGRTSPSDSTAIAACRASDGRWYDCSPKEDNAINYAQFVSFTNGQWIILGDMTRDDSDYTSHAARCMTNSTGNWQNCDLTVYEPQDDAFGDSWGGIHYIPASKEWVGVSIGYRDNGDGLYLKSICRKDNETVWTHCFDEMFTSGGITRFAQNDRGELLLISVFSADLALNSQIFCRSPNAGWRECAESMEERNLLFYGATVGEDGKWVLLGNHFSNNLMENTAYVTAVKEDDDFWNVTRQTPYNSQSYLTDIIFVSE